MKPAAVVDYEIVYPVSIPDELLVWAREPSRRIRWRVDYAAEIDALVAKAPLSPRDTERLVNRLSALCSEAIDAGQGNLLLGFDAALASMLGLVFRFQAGGRDVVVRSGPRRPSDGTAEHWDLRELELVRAAPAGAYEACRRTKELLGEVFEGVIVEAVSKDEEPLACATCGESLSSVMLHLDYGSSFCRACWRSLTSRERGRDAGSKRRGIR
jgi:hypothetical protein